MRVDGAGTVIVGLGARTPVGADTPSSAAAVRAGIGILAEHPWLFDRIGEPMIVARATYLPERLAGTDRLVELARPALREAAAPLLGKGGPKTPLPLVLGVPPARPGRSPNLEKHLADALRDAVPELGPLPSVKTFPAGHAAGLLAMLEACRAVASGSAEACFVGGVDSYIERETLVWLDDQEQLHSKRCPWGFAPGEAAGFCLLASERFARARGLEPLARVVCGADGVEKNRIKTGTVCLGLGLTDAVRSAVNGPPAIPGKISDTICDMNGEAYRADEFGFMISRLSDRFVNAPDYTAPANCWGDVGAASGPLFAGLAVAAARKGYGRGPLSLLWASSEGGERAAVLVSTDVRRN